MRELELGRELELRRELELGRELERAREGEVKRAGRLSMLRSYGHLVGACSVGGAAAAAARAVRSGSRTAMSARSCSAPLNVAEGSYSRKGNRKLRYHTALASLREALACFKQPPRSGTCPRSMQRCAGVSITCSARWCAWSAATDCSTASCRFEDGCVLLRLATAAGRDTCSVLPNQPHQRAEHMVEALVSERHRDQACIPVPQPSRSMRALRAAIQAPCGT